MSFVAHGAIDCDVHPHVPHIRRLFPYLDDYWRDMADTRGMDGFTTRAYPPGAAITCRPEWRGKDGAPGGDVQAFRTQLFDRWGASHAILTCLYGVQLIHDPYLAAAFARAVNDWLVKEWLDVEPRLRAAIVVPTQDPELAVEEIERRAPDPRFLTVLVLAMSDVPLGKRFWWPIYAAAERHGLPVTIHAGSTYHHAPTAVGWPSYHVEDYVAQATGFQAQLASLVAHGVFRKFPGLKVVLAESGIAWLPSFLWRFGKFWRGLRVEVPWVDRPPAEIVRDHVRLTLQPFDAPPAAGDVERLCEHLRSDEILLYASDYPHWQFDGDAVIPAGLPAPLVQKMLAENALRTYPRLGGGP